MNHQREHFTVQLKTNILKVLHELSTCMSDKPNFKRNAVLCAKMIEVSKLILIFFSTPPPLFLHVCVRKTLKSKDLNYEKDYIGIGSHLFFYLALSYASELSFTNLVYRFQVNQSSMRINPLQPTEFSAVTFMKTRLTFKDLKKIQLFI